MAVPFLFLLSIELALHILKPDLKAYSQTFRMNTQKTDARRFSAIKEPDPDLLWRLKPNSQLSSNEHLNSRGFRTQEFELQKKENSRRIIILGDSRSFGFGLENKNEIYSERIQTYFSSQKKNDVQVLNLSVIGYSSYQGLRLMDTMVSKMQPSQLIVWFGFNDLLYYHVTDQANATRSALFTSAEILMNQSYLYQWLRIFFKMHLTPDKVDLEQNITPRVPINDFRKNLISILEKSRILSCPVVFMISPVRKNVPMVLNSKIRLIKQEDGRQYRKLITQYEIGDFWLMNATEFPGSESELDKLLMDNDDLAILHYFKGVLFQKRGEIQKASEQFNLASEMDDTRRIVDQYNQVVVEVAREYNAGLIDLTEQFNEFDDYSLFVDDCHPNSNGHNLIAAKLLEYMTNIKSKIRTDN